MATTSTNWVFDNTNVSEKDIRALEKAKRMEKEKLAQGYRYVKINDKMQVLVPFGKDGKPTAKGEEIIRQKKLIYGIK